MAGTLVSSILHFTNKLVATIQISSVSASSSSSSCNSSSVDEDLKKLKRTLLRIQAVLHDAEEREIRDMSVKLWLKELKDVAYDAVDVLDEYNYELLRSKLEAEETTTGKRKREEDIKDIAYYDANVVSDEHIYKSPRSKVEDRAVTKISSGKWKLEDEVNQLTTSLDAKVSIHDSIAQKIVKIRERFDEIAKDRDALHLREGDGERRFENTMARPPTSSHVDELGVYGRKVVKSELIELLLSEDKCGRGNFSVIPIVGMGGIGKTTLAQLVYKDLRICEYFDQRAWVCVSSEDFDVIRLTRAIIESITRRPCSLTELSTLQDTLQKELMGKKVLLVLDDVWNEVRRHWETLRAPFITPGVIKIIITTRIESVAKIMQTMPHIRLEYLPEDQCFLLFQQWAFGGQDHKANTNLVEIGKKIIKKCGGLPLAVKTLASLLQYEANEDRWMDILESDLWELDEKNDETMIALRLSYHHMPTCLKPCFVYCSLFPKGHKFSKKSLVKLWMAHGFVQLRGSKRMEDIGGEYFDELLNRSFFQKYFDKFLTSWPFFQKESNERDKFVMHDLIHDVAQFISHKECFRIESEKAANDIPIEARHVSMIHSRELKQFRSCNKLRSLLTFLGPFLSFANDGIPVKMLNDMFLNCGCLRALDLSGILLEQLPESIGNLKHLRYLRLGEGTIESLPESVCQLYNLQTLDLSHCLSRRILPRGIRNLINLRDLRLTTATQHVIIPPGVGKLTALQTMTSFHVGKCSTSCGIQELKELVNLRGGLMIRGLSSVSNVEDAKEANLKGKRCLKELALQWMCHDCIFDDCICEDCMSAIDGVGVIEREEGMLQALQPHTNLECLSIGSYRGVRFPNWIGDPSFCNLVTLELYDCYNCEFLPPLGQLPSLRNLRIQGMDIRSVGREFSCLSEGAVIKGFPSLETLHFSDMYKWEEWCEVLDGEFPQLSELVLESCHILTSVAPGLQNMTSLQEFRISDCRKLRLLKDDWPRCMPKYLSYRMCPKMEELSRRHGLPNYKDMVFPALESDFELRPLLESDFKFAGI